MATTPDFLFGVLPEGDALERLRFPGPLTIEDLGVPYKPTFAPREIAEYFGVSVRTVQREIEDGNLRAVIVRGTPRIPLAELKRYVLCQQAAIALGLEPGDPQV